MTRLDAIQARYQVDSSLVGRDVAWLVEMVETFSRAAELTGHSAHEHGCNMCAALARLEELDASVECKSARIAALRNKP